MLEGHVVRRRAARQTLAATLTTVALLLGVLGVSPVRGLAFTFNVNSTADIEDDDLANPSCHASNGKCTLRAAVGQASLLDPGAGHHTINVPAGTYTLKLVGTEETFSAAGDLNVRYSMNIIGAGSGSTYIQASTEISTPGIDRLFMVNADHVKLVIKSLTMRRGNGFGDGGGAVLSEYSTGSVAIDRVVITNNRTTGKGSAIKSFGSLTITNSYLSNNTSLGPTVDHSDGNLTVRNSTFTGNTNGTGTLRHYGETGSALVDRSTFYDNTMGLAGYGTIGVGENDTDASKLTIWNSTLSGNHGNGAAIRAYDDAILAIESATIANNDGPGLWSSSDTTIKNTILSANGTDNCVTTSPGSLGHNLDSRDDCKFGGAPGDIINGNAALGTLKDNGGSTWTRGLGAASDARDAGAGCQSTDQRGVARPRDSDGDGIKVCDIGAFEAGNVSTATPAPTSAPTSAPTAAPTTAPTEPPPSASAPATEGPAETGAASADPSASVAAGETPAGPAPTPGPTAAPLPASDGLSQTSILWIAIGLMAVLLAFGLGGMVRRRSSR
jgi:CSLREA domain-containing protein